MNAVMIMCHKNPNQVLRLINRCKSPDTKVIVHVDARRDGVYDELVARAGGAYFTKNRFAGELDKRSLVDIALEMIHRAQEIEASENIHFDYYLLLSGQDYLVKPIGEINRLLLEAYPTPYIDCTPYDRHNWVYHKFKANRSLEKYHQWVVAKFPKRGTFLRRCFLALEIIGQKIAQTFHKNDYYRLRKQGLSLYGGSAWWILPDKAINYISGEYDARKSYVEALLATMTPEETFFQIMAMRSPIKDLVQINPIDMVAQNCKTFAYFSDAGKPFKGHPYTLTVLQYGMLIEKGCWIARKFEMSEDSEIFDLLDKREI